MALPKDLNVSPAAMGIAGIALITALIDELIHSQIIKRADMERVLDSAQRGAHQWSTQGPFREAITLISAIRDDLTKAD